MIKKITYADLLGKPFLLGARGPNEYDCWGLCLEIGKRAGIIYPKDFTPDDSITQNDKIAYYRDRDFLKIEKPEPYCIAVYSLAVAPPLVDHCGIVLPEKDGVTCFKMIHILRQHSVAVVRLNNPFIVRKLSGFYKLCPAK